MTTHPSRNLNAKLCRGLVALVSCAALSACTINGGDLAKQRQEELESAQPTFDDPGSTVATPSPSTDSEATPESTPDSDVAPGDVTAVAEAAAAAGGAIAIAAAGEVATAGSVDMPAWSTMKVPVAIAALRHDPSVASFVAPAIQQSSNADAEALWSSMGDPGTAGQLTGAVLAEGGSSATVQTSVVRPGFSSFGQTQWPLDQQAQFATKLRCINGSEQVVANMGRVSADQSYGLGRIPGALFKGGWGPDESGMYKVRQFGLVPAGDGYIGVAIAAAAPDGSYESGQEILNQMASIVQRHLGSLQASAC
ncbi:MULTISPECIES: hypothetical protein [Corynebacterium]|uniref:hypothetical protein n=1 Tax=Corynebacterium TaxID=1716 RepID=UPI001CE4B575|nr:MULTISPECIES: hypothetical protein [Corynebacterium]